MLHGIRAQQGKHQEVGGKKIDKRKIHCHFSLCVRETYQREKEVTHFDERDDVQWDKAHAE